MRRAVSAGMLVLALCLPASATKLSGPEVRDMVVTGTVFLETGFGDFPLRYDQAGRVTGDGTALGLARFFAPRETGRWWVDGDQLCQQWPSWYRGRTFCFNIILTGADKFRWVRDDGYAGNGRIMR